MCIKSFEMLVLDPGKKTNYQDAKSLFFALRGFSKLWKNPDLDEGNLTIQDGTTKLCVTDQAAVVNEDDSTKTTTSAFSITLSGEFDDIEPLRVYITEYLVEQKFGYRYITKDEISEQIACELYPYLYRLENKLRRYLTRFMTTRMGGEWWKVTASKQMADKANNRKGNEIIFGKHTHNDSFLIDFDDLGELVFQQTSGYLTREDIANRLMSLPETVDDIKKLKAELRSNYHKFFKETFADKDFKPKWEFWFKLRNKIAHNNLFTKKDLIEGIKLAEEIIQIIDDAEKSPEQPKASQLEREAIQEQFIAQELKEDIESSHGESSEMSLPISSNSLSEEEFLRELEEQEKFYSQRPSGFVGLMRFLRYHLTELGHSQAEAEEVLNKLQRKNIVEVYYVENPYGYGFSQTAALKKVIA